MNPSSCCADPLRDPVPSKPVFTADGRVASTILRPDNQLQLLEVLTTLSADPRLNGSEDATRCEMPLGRAAGPCRSARRRTASVDGCGAPRAHLAGVAGRRGMAMGTMSRAGSSPCAHPLPACRLGWVIPLARQPPLWRGTTSLGPTLSSGRKTPGPHRTGLSSVGPSGGRSRLQRRHRA